MDELTQSIPHKPVISEANALSDLLGMLNNPAITGATKPPPVETEPTTQQVIVAPPPPAQRTAPLGNRLFFTGRLGVGKDYCATQVRANIFGFADPLYEVANLFFNLAVTASANKDLPGMRDFLQQLGQWGRGTVNEKYPVSSQRAVFITMIRSMAATLPAGVAWDTFGSSDSIWLDACLARVTGDRAAITNVRFENEYKGLQQAGYEAWHVMSSPATWENRLKKKGLAATSPATKDTSEQLAAFLDADVTKKISQQRNGPKLRVIWNDDTPAPSARLYTLAEFKTLAA